MAHINLLSIDAHLLSHFVRSLSAPFASLWSLWCSLALSLRSFAHSLSAPFASLRSLWHSLALSLCSFAHSLSAPFASLRSLWRSLALSLHSFARLLHSIQLSLAHHSCFHMYRASLPTFLRTTNLSNQGPFFHKFVHTNFPTYHSIALCISLCAYHFDQKYSFHQILLKYSFHKIAKCAGTPMFYTTTDY